MPKGFVLSLFLLGAGGIVTASGSGYPIGGTGEITLTGRKSVTFSVVAERESVRFSVNYPPLGEGGGDSADELESITLEGPAMKVPLAWDKSGSGLPCTSFSLPKSALAGIHLNLSFREHEAGNAGKVRLQPRVVVLEMLWAWDTAKGPIDHLVAGLMGDFGEWMNGLSPSIDLPAEAEVEELVKRVFELDSFPLKKEDGKAFDDSAHVQTHKVLETRQVKITGMDFTAVLVETDLGQKVLLFHHWGTAGSWWHRPFDADEIEKLAPAGTRH